MSTRPKRFTSSRSMSPQKRKALATGEVQEEEENTPLSFGKNWFLQQTPMSQIYYAKIAIGFALGIVGLLYQNPIIAGNWFIFPLIGLAGCYVLARSYLGITKDDVDDLRLLAWHGTISLFIAFIASSVLVDMIFFPPNIHF